MKNLAMIGVLTLSLAVIGCADKGDTGDRAGNILALTGDSAAGETAYTANCLGCHQEDGAGNETYPSVQGAALNEAHVNIVLSGSGSMPSFSSILSDQDIADVFAYIGTL